MKKVGSAVLAHVRKVNIFGTRMVVPLDTSCRVEVTHTLAFNFMEVPSSKLKRGWKWAAIFQGTIDVRTTLLHAHFPEQTLQVSSGIYTLRTRNVRWVRNRIRTDEREGYVLRSGVDTWFANQVRKREITDAILNMFIEGNVHSVGLQHLLPRIKLSR